MVYNSWRLPPKAAMSTWLRVVVQIKRNGGSENQSRRISNKRVETVCSATAFFLGRRPADCFFILERADNYRIFKNTGYRLCVCASGSLMTVTCKFFTLIKVSCLHFGQ